MKTVKEKTALAAIFLKVGFTAVKFIAFFLSGSLAVLAEAWHSFTDVLTSVLVYFSVKEKTICIYPIKKDEKQSQIKYFVKKWKEVIGDIDAEYKVAFIIGLILTIVSLFLFKGAIFFKARQIQKAFGSGIIFVLFSFLSYVTYKFEINIGRKENSAAIISDGMHSRADMFSSLLTGFSLILYSMGINIDRFAAMLIAFFVFFSALEVMVNIISNVVKADKYVPATGEKLYFFNYKAFDILFLLFEKEIWQKSIFFIDDKLHLGLCKSRILKTVAAHFRLFIVTTFLLLYFSTCFYVIKPYQQGIVERFGKPSNTGCSAEPGLHFKYPWPIEKVIPVTSKIVFQKNIGNITDKNTFALLWTSQHGTEEAFLSGDNNFFHPYLVVHYKVKDVFQFYYNNKNCEKLIDNICSRVITNIFAKMFFSEIITVYRKQFRADVIYAMQKELDKFKSGIEIVDLNLKDMHPPIFIADAFEDVIAAFQDKERKINEAVAYRNRSLPEARAEAKRTTSKAESYVIEKTNQALGEGDRFQKQLEAYKINTDISLKRLYLQVLKEGMQDNPKIIIDPKSGIPDIWLDFENMIPSQY